ncbi:hypothetical protein [Streptomyces sp. CoH17]|uniref:hypothetical protein n=1 Tax=Streptomyces sp. CoH17 TaxID=2992806 RepID=UPI002270420D|nr:hypothetical protein [Streptomyces sp. CoH17]
MVLLVVSVVLTFVMFTFVDDNFALIMTLLVFVLITACSAVWFFIQSYRVVEGERDS